MRFDENAFTTLVKHGQYVWLHHRALVCNATVHLEQWSGEHCEKLFFSNKQQS
jgi:hypothetical protein